MSVRDQPMSVAQMALVCSRCFDEDGDVVNDVDFPRSLFLSHLWLMDSPTLLAHFLAILEQERNNATVRLGACAAVAYWIRTFPMHFDNNPQLCALVVKMRTIAEDVPEDIRQLLDVSNLPSYAWLRALSVRQPIARQVSVSLSFDQWSPEDISTSLSHIDYRVLRRIPISELKAYVKEGNLCKTPILERSISVFNNLTNWVQCMILSKATPKERCDVLTKFICVGKHLRKLCNYNTLMAVVGGVTHSNIGRLSKTSALLNNDIKKELAQLTNLLSIQGNFAEYRKALQSSNSHFRMPIVGIHLKDLIAANCMGESFDISRTCTSRRIYRLASLLSYFLLFNNRPHNFPDVNLDLINTLKVALDIRYNEEDIYELSLRREPRTFINFEPRTQVVFADWASGVSATLDPQTVNKHVSAMVDAVFKHYDHDRDGYISQEEFRQISGNFPFISPFGTIDLDRDGQISREEMKAYFIKANKDSLEFRMGFQHNFHETTFLAPTSCNHCGKLLWGLIRQGWKCKDCGLAVHACCKDSAVAECRRKATATSTFGDWLSPRSVAPKQRLFLNYKFFRSFRSSSGRFRTVSTVSTSPSPEPGNLAECSNASGPLSCRSQPNLPLPLSRKTTRPQSESAELYKSGGGLSPEDELGTVSLACEEVFEDESVASEATAT